jgi:hypothetical protein
MPSRRQSTVAVATDSGDGLQQFAAVLSVQSLDLRAEYEAKLRVLTDIQRQIEALRAPGASPLQRQRTLDSLARRFAELTAANRDASETLRMIREEFERVQRGRPR